MTQAEAFNRYFTPQTEDGRVRSIEFQSPFEFKAVVAFPCGPEMRKRLSHPERELIFCARSRVCRLGISLRPLEPAAITDTEIVLEVAGRILIKNVGIERHLPEALVPGTPVGRMVLCDHAKRLTSAEVSEALGRNELKLPSQFSLAADGRVSFPSQLVQYRFRFALQREHLIAVLTREDGKDFLNFMQVREAVPRLQLNPGEAVITSCSMFLDRHFFVLDAEDNLHGRHFHARVLDPTETRMSNAFLEIENDQAELIVNPNASGYLFKADETSGRILSSPSGTRSFETASYSDAEAAFNRLTNGSSLRDYRDRPMALMDGLSSDESHELAAVQQTSLAPSALLRALNEAKESANGESASLFCQFFPDAFEHSAIVSAGVDEIFKSLVFRQASYERGPFLSERDHMRLVDYTEAGIEVFWANSIFEHLAVFVPRSRRGFFVSPGSLARFRDALLVGVYGSTLDLPPAGASAMADLLGRLAAFLGSNVGFLTGGGGGVMRLVLETGRRLECLVGSNFLENADQNLDKHIDFYQTFQSSARHMRQRWFEVARCHLFAIGGVGTLEEIGMTLTDIKLGLMNTDPVVLFGASAKSPYWRSLGEQLRMISREGRGPKWLETNVLVTDDVDEAIQFYKRILQVG